MAKKQSSKKKLPKTTGGLSVFWNKHWQVILIAILVFGILGFIGVNRLIIYNQKKQFDQAEKSLDTLYANIVKDVGKPTSMTKDRSCDYASTEGGRGNRTCGVNFVLIYAGDSTESNLKALAAIKSLKSDSAIEIPYQKIGSFKEGSNSTYSNDYATDIKFTNVKNKDCSLSANYFDKDSPNNHTKMGGSYLEIGFGCSGDSKAEFYPVKN